MADVERAWWRDGVIYQIYPRSFADSNGDGIGDLRGITDHLDYLNDGTRHSLGIDGIWLSPIYPSPMHDFGYDVSDYCAISPEFGTLDDFKTLLHEAHARGIHIIMDLVLNHTSHEHPWFREARASRSSPKRDWYIWHDGVQSKAPNNWMAAFGGGAWEWEPSSQQFYLHSFLPEQPDVNWRNPDLAAAMEDVIRFWLDVGVDGFRLDVVNWFLKDADFRSNPTRLFGRRAYDRQIHLFDRNRPETVAIMKRLRAVVDEYSDRMTIGEVFQEPPADPALPAAYYANGAGLHQAFNFAFLYCKWDPDAFAAAVAAWETILPETCWPNYTLSNHDQPRAYSRYAVGGEGDARARVAAAMLLTLRGTPYLYYGEELGMRNGRLRRAHLRDPVGVRYWPAPVGRDPERTPMLWTGEPGAGFTSGTPWLPINAEYRGVNVAAQSRDPHSLLAWYQALIQLRKREPALRRGAYRRMRETGAGVLGYTRGDEHDRVVVLLNFERFPQQGFLPPDARWRVLLSTDEPEGTVLSGGSVTVPGYAVTIVKVERRGGP